MATSRDRKRIFAEKLVELRTSAGLSQAQIAGGIGSAQSSIAEWESAKSLPRRKTLLKLAMFLDVDPLDLDSDFIGYVDTSDITKELIKKRAIEFSDAAPGFVEALLYESLFKDVQKILSKRSEVVRSPSFVNRYLCGVPAAGAVAMALTTKTLWDAAREMDETFVQALAFETGGLTGYVDAIEAVLALDRLVQSSNRADDKDDTD